MVRNGLVIYGMAKGGSNLELFVFGDIHGHLKELERDLQDAGYDEDNSNHLLIVLGDNFDRGTESKEVFLKFKKLTSEGKAIVLHGNHEDFIIDFLEGKDCMFNFKHNGFNKTLDSFLDQTCSWEMFCFMCNSDPDMAIALYGNRVKPLLEDFYSIPVEVAFDVYQEYARQEIRKNYKDLLPWLRSLPYYYETEHYIFTHAAIDGSCDNWKEPKYTKYEFWTPWQYLTWDDGSFYVEPINNTPKTVVVGHFHTDAIRDKYDLPDGEVENDILYGDRKIFLDTCTILTKRVNILKINDNLEEENRNESN